MGKIKDAILSSIDNFDTKWINIEEPSLTHADELEANTKIVLKIIQYMKNNGLKQKDLAQKLGVSPQYINKLLRGQEVNLTISSAIRYGKLLGIELVSIPEDIVNETSVSASMTMKVQTLRPRPATDYSCNTKYNGLIINNKSYQRYGRGIS